MASLSEGNQDKLVKPVGAFLFKYTHKQEVMTSTIADHYKLSPDKSDSKAPSEATDLEAGNSNNKSIFSRSGDYSRLPDVLLPTFYIIIEIQTKRLNKCKSVCSGRMCRLSSQKM